MKKKHMAGMVISFFLLLLIAGGAAAEVQGLKKIVLLPFEVYSAGDSDRLRDDLHSALMAEMGRVRSIGLLDRGALMSMIQGQRLGESLALDLLIKTGGDFAVMGSVTEIGGAVSVEVRIIEAKNQTLLESTYVQGRMADGIRALGKQIADQLVAKLQAGNVIILVEIKGNRKIAAPAIMQVLQTKPGGLYSEARIAADIKAIFRLGYFSEVSASLREEPQGRVVTFEVQEKPVISEIVITGNKAIKRADIEEVMTIKVRQTLNREKIKEDVEKIRELYNRKGYLNTFVADEVRIEREQEARVTIGIKESKKLYVRRISFIGNHVFSDRSLKKLMSLKEKGLFSFLTDSGILNQEELKQDMQKVAAFYMNNGFINVQVGEPEITHDDSGIYVAVQIVEGQQFQVGKVEITGDTLKVSRETLLAGLNLTGKPYYDRGAVLRDIEYLTQACSDEGFAYAEVTPQTTVDEKKNVVDIVYHIKKGQQVFVNRINILGNTKTRDKVIRRQMELEEGQLFSSSKLKASFLNLNRLRYFEEVDFQSERGPAENLTDINVQIKEKPTGMFSIGAGYSAIDHAVFTAVISQQNLFGRGQVLSLKATLGSSSSMYDISFIEPWLFDIPLWMKLDAWDSAREYDTYHLGTRGFGISFGYPLWRNVSGYIGYRLASNEISKIKDNAAFYIKQQEGKTTAISLSTGLTRDTTDDTMFPSRGSKNSFGVDYTGGFLGGDTSFLRYMLTSSWFFPLPLSTTFSVRGRIGYMQEVGGKEVPIYERFFLGGMNSLRGLRSIGPADPATGDIIGGLTMFNANIEFLFPLLKEAGMKGVIFYDTGNSWLSGYNLGNLRHTAGVGIRWYSPIGPLRLEWGHVLDRKADESPNRWEFTIGLMM